MDKNKLFNILEMPTLKLMKYLNSAIRRKHYDIYTDDDNYIFAVPKKASNHIMLVSHMDTVKRGKVKLIENNGIVTNAHGVLGADDRAGVFAVLEIVNKCIKGGQSLPYLLFTNYEECGGLGVKQFCKDRIAENVESDIYLMIELDRRGINDAVYYSEPEKELKALVSAIGYNESWGSYSDVSTLSDRNDIAHVNLSIGYFNEHTASELLVLSVVEYAIDNVLALMPMITRQYQIDPLAGWQTSGKWGTYYGGGYSRKSSYDYTYNYKGKKKEEKTLALPENPSIDRSEDKYWYSLENKVCPNCMSWEGVEEYKGLGTAKCWDCGCYFDDDYNILEDGQSDDEVIQQMLETIDGKKV